MNPLRVLVVDDSVVVRRLVSTALEADPRIEVIGSAPNGRIALAKIEQHRPDAVTLDVEMPVMDGLEALREIRRRWPDLAVVMFSTLTERGATATLEALALGASDYVTKPSSTHDLDEGVAAVRRELAPKLLALCPRRGAPTTTPGAPAARLRTPRAASPAAPAPVPVRARPARPDQRVDVVAIGVSTGGPNALAEVLPALAGSLPVPVVVVQHMPPLFTKLLAERLDARCAVRVVESAGGEMLLPGTVYVAPGGRHLVVERSGPLVMTRLDDGPPESSCRPAVDPLLRSVADVYGAHALAVVLTGMGQDGLRGVEAVAAAGGQVLAQDERTSVVWGMPGFVARSGLADDVLPLDRVADEIARRSAVGRVRVGAPA